MIRVAALGAALAIAALVSAGTAAAATPPSASTGPVASVGPTSATVDGSVNPNGVATTWYVEYGTSTSYGTKTAAKSAGSGTASTSISATLTGLKAGTSYHYRVVATSTSGTAHGADGLLTTSAAPQVATGGASSVTSTSATLNGTVNPSSRATTWYFEYGTSTSYGSKTPAKDAGSGTNAVGASAGITALTPGRTYHFRIVATSDAGTSRGADHTFLASAAPVVATKPVSAVKDTTATLHGTANPNGQATTAYFEYGTTTGYGSKSAVKSVGSGTGTANVSTGVGGLAAGTTYHFRIVATNATGTSVGTDQTFTTTGAPGVKTGTATATTSSGSTLTGSVDSRGHSTSWYFQYGTTAAYGSRTPTRSQSATAGARSVSEAIGGLTAGTTYHFRLVATNGSGTSLGADVAFATGGPAVTVVASATTVIHGNRITLSGRVASLHPNERVTVFAQRWGAGSFASVTTVLTDAGGNWSTLVRPTIATTYKSVWNSSPSGTVSVAVRPAVSIRVLKHSRVSTHVAAARSFRGRVVQLQRHLLDGGWRTIGRVRLDRHSNAVFHLKLRRGVSTLRVAFSVNQAGGGYLGGFSRRILVRR